MAGYRLQGNPRKPCQRYRELDPYQEEISDSLRGDALSELFSALLF